MNKPGRVERPNWIVRYREGIFTTLGLLVTLIVATVTGWSSWAHIVHVGRLAQEPNAAVLPVAIDGLMITGTVMAAVDRFRGMTTRGWAVAALWIGSLLTLTFNMASAMSRGYFAMGIAVLYAVALLVTVETMFHPSRTPLNAVKKKFRKEAPEVVAPEPVTAPAATVEPATPKVIEPAPTGRPGRKAGVPQAPPQGRRKPKRTSPGPAPSRAANGAKVPQEKPMQVTVVKAESPDLPLAMDERVSDLVAGSTDREVTETVVS